jgi:hypothetical protein
MVTDRTSFPVARTSATVGNIGDSLKGVHISGNNVAGFIVGATAVKAGQVVSISATGIDWTVIPCVAEAGSFPIGVAITDGAVGKLVSVAMIGCIARVSNYASDVNIDASERLTYNDAAPGGTVIACSGANTLPLVGRALADDTGSYLELTPMLIMCGANCTIHA